MKKIFLFISFLTLITPLFSQHDCYVVGYASDDSIHFYSKVWKNGEVLFSIKDGIHNIAPWNIIVTDSEDVYVSTIYNENASYVGDARVWKNGLELYTIAGAYARGLAIDGEDVYMSGGKYFYMGNAAAKVWKNGEELYSLSHSNIPAGVLNMCISDGNIYVVGWETKPPPGGTGPGIESARVWKNGEQLYDLSNNRSFAYSVFIDGDDVYVGGQEYLYSSVIYGSYVVARVWKNGEVLHTFSYPDLPDDSYATVMSLVVSNNDVYAAGYMGAGGNYYIGKVWKNGEELYSFPYQVWVSSQCPKLQVINNDVYSLYTRYSGFVSRVHKNGEVLYDLQGCDAVSMFIIPDSTISVKESETNHINVYPNPTSDKITISMPENSHTALFVLYDIAGRELLRKTIKHEECIDVSRFVSGVYIYTVESEGQKSTGKLIIN